MMVGLIAITFCLLLAGTAVAATSYLLIAEDSTAFSYYKKDKEYQRSYYLAPDALFEECDACLSWAGLAFDAALRNPNKKKRT